MSDARPQPANPVEYAGQCCRHGLALVQERRLDEAKAEFEDALRSDPGSADAHYGLGECMLLRGRLDDAITRYTECLRVNPRHLQAHYSLGNVYLTKNRFGEAVRHFMAVLATDPGHFMAIYQIGRCHEKKGQLAEAFQQYRYAVSISPGFIDAYLAAAGCLVAQGRERDAIGEYRRIIARFPDRTDVRETLIGLLERLNLFDEAISEYRTLQALRPGDIEVRLHIAGLMDRSGMIRDSIEEYERVIEMSPRNSFAHVKRKILLQEREMIDKLTDRYLSQVINRLAKISVHFRESMKLYLDGCYEAAMDELARDLALVPTPDSYFARGACIVRTGNLLAAIPDFREAVRLRPDFPEAHTMLGILYERHGLLYEATEEYLQGVKEAQEQIRAGPKKAPVDSRSAEPAFRFYRL